MPQQIENLSSAGSAKAAARLIGALPLETLRLESGRGWVIMSEEDGSAKPGRFDEAMSVKGGATSKATRERQRRIRLNDRYVWSKHAFNRQDSLLKPLACITPFCASAVPQYGYHSTGNTATKDMIQRAASWSWQSLLILGRRPRQTRPA